MRKKSHISLAGQIMNSMELDNVFDYRLPFYVGSIWPDCRPSFVTTPHKFVLHLMILNVRFQNLLPITIKIRE